MIKKTTLAIAATILLSACTAQQVQDFSKVAQQSGLGGNLLGNADVANGLKEALNKGVGTAVGSLSSGDGFWRDQAVKILLPPELQQVDKTLRSIGMGKLADEGLKLMNTAASDAAGTAKDVFVTAVQQMTFQDAMGILMGGKDSATQYLKKTSTDQLYTKFSPIVQNSLGKVGATKVWTDMITRYNQIPTVKKVNPDLTNYVTNKAMDGVFLKVAQEELSIRTNPAERSTDLLKRVFAKQDVK